MIGSGLIMIIRDSARKGKGTYAVCVNKFSIKPSSQYSYSLKSSK